MKKKILILTLLPIVVIIATSIHFFINGTPWSHQQAINVAKEFISDKYHMDIDQLSSEGTAYMWNKGMFSVVLKDNATMEKYFIELKLSRNDVALRIEEIDRSQIMNE